MYLTWTQDIPLHLFHVPTDAFHCGFVFSWNAHWPYQEEENIVGYEIISGPA